LISFVLLLHASQRHPEANAQANVPSGWSRAKDAFDRLIREPSSLTGSEFYVSISGGKGMDSDKTEILDHIFGRNPDLFSSSRYGTIAIEMLQGDIYAAKSAIRLLEFVDNGWQRPRSVTTRAAGWMGESLGDLVRVDPALFLRACYEERENPYLKEKGLPVGFVPGIMNKKTTRASYELEMRRKALQLVEDQELRLVRDLCIEAIDREIKKYGLDGHGLEEHEEKPLEDPRAEIKNVFAEMQSRPSPENMKKVLALFSDLPTENLPDLILAISPPTNSAGRQWPSPLGIIIHEAICCNEYAIEVSFRALVHFFGIQSMEICSTISNLILIKPALFIENLAKYRQLLEYVDSISVPQVHYFEWTCDYISPWDYADVRIDLILRRRIDALAALNMPEHKELIARCIRLLEKKLK
jgi:hypothetical protein